MVWYVLLHWELSDLLTNVWKCHEMKALGNSENVAKWSCERHNTVHVVNNLNPDIYSKWWSIVKKRAALVRAVGLHWLMDKLDRMNEGKEAVCVCGCVSVYMMIGLCLMGVSVRLCVGVCVWEQLFKSLEPEDSAGQYGIFTSWYNVFHIGR